MGEPVDTARVAEILARTLDDRRLSKGERKALREVFTDLRPDHRMRAVYAAKAKEAAIAALTDARDSDVIEWLVDVLAILRGSEPDLRPPPSEAWFSPGGKMARHVAGFLESASRTLDICVFTITDDRISDALSGCARRGITVRIITDDEKMYDPGSDIRRFIREKIPVRTDHSSDHMHHKFAIADRQRLLTGSFNWTLSGDVRNQENAIVTSDAHLVTAFVREFEKLWRAFAP